MAVVQQPISVRYFGAKLVQLFIKHTPFFLSFFSFAITSFVLGLVKMYKQLKLIQLTPSK